ncbi:MAG: DUF4811 domain-containing protein [Streptococcaceae bacterium]|jgi:hypothetical protein|nr:DUF4811 domain-containing protein [Streptococcaceae bacterium]
MIILLIILFAATTIIGFFYLKGVLSWLVGIFSLLVLAFSMVGLIYHDNTHWGMKEVTTRTSHEIYTAGDPAQAWGLVIKAEIGTNTGNYVFVYRNGIDDKKPETNFKPDTKHIVEAVLKSANYQLTSDSNAKVVTNTTRYEWSNNLAKWLFGVGGEAGDLVKQRSTVYVPKDTWLLLTAAQVEKLQKELPTLQAQMKAQLAANPAEALQLQELQKNNPTAYAAMQVTQIKKILGITD